jgi:hypothetical protein
MFALAYFDYYADLLTYSYSVDDFNSSKRGWSLWIKTLNFYGHGNYAF